MKYFLSFFEVYIESKFEALFKIKIMNKRTI